MRKKANLVAGVRTRFIISLLFWGLQPMFFGSSALAATIHVPADWPTIQAAINVAVGGDEIIAGDENIVAPGTYFENINFLGKAITLRSSDGPLMTIIDAYIKDRQAIPKPSKVRRESVPLPALMVAKIGLYSAMRKQHIGKAELARRLNWHLPQVDRVLNVRHASRLDQLEQAMEAVGKRLTVRIENCA